MKKLINLLIIVFIINNVNAQETATSFARPMNARDSFFFRQVQSLYEAGMEKSNDSLVVQEEVFRLMKDSAYRQLVYPKKYDWEHALTMLKSMEFKKGFWQLINLYQSDKQKRGYVIAVMIMYDGLLTMDEVLLNTYYTYGLSDPRVTRLVDNKPDIFRPDLLEQGLNATRELVQYIRSYRNYKEKKLQATGKP
jgi:hypothetical protein